MNPDDKPEFLAGMSLREAAQALHEGRLALDFGGPAKTLGDKIARHLYVKSLNEELEKMGSPCQIVPREDT